MLSIDSQKKVIPWMKIFHIVYKHLSHYLLSLVCADIRTAGIYCMSGNCFKWLHHRKKHRHQQQKGMLGKLVASTKCFEKTPLCCSMDSKQICLHSLKVSYFQMQIIWCVMKGNKPLFPEYKIKLTEFTKGQKKVEALTNGFVSDF